MFRDIWRPPGRSLQERRLRPGYQKLPLRPEAGAVHTEVAALLSQAQSFQQDYSQRLDSAQQLKKEFKYPEAAELLRTLAAEYPWDEQSRALLKECEAASQKIESLRQEARQALEHKQFDKAIPGLRVTATDQAHHPDVTAILPRASAMKSGSIRPAWKRSSNSAKVPLCPSGRVTPLAGDRLPLGRPTEKSEN